MRAVATKQVDYGAAFNGAIAKVVSTGAPVTSVITYYGSDKQVSSSMLVRKDSDITGARDLIGKKVAVNTLGANAEAVLDTYLEREGLSQEEIEQVTLVPLPGINTEAALRERQVDAAWLGGSLKEIALANGGVRSIVSDVELVGPYNAGGIVMREDFLKSNPDLAEKFVAGLAKAIEYAQTHPVAKVRKLLQDYLVEQGREDDAKALDLWKGLGIATKGGVIRDEDFELWLDWLESSGEVEKGSVDPAEIYTNEYNPYAE